MGDKELYFRNILAVVFRVAGYKDEEKAMAQGRADLVVRSDRYLYVMGLKQNGSARQAHDQTNEKGYADAYTTDDCPIVKLGLNFSEEKRIIDDYAFEISKLTYYPAFQGASLVRL